MRNAVMAESAIPVDLRNPGQVFACLGILEMTDVLLGDAAAAFDWISGSETEFRVAAADAEPPVERVLRFLEEARIVTRAPAGSANPDRWKSGWGDAPELDDPGRPFPFPDPSAPATLPVVLRDDIGNEVALDYWGDSTKLTGRDNVKYWAGARGKPGAAILLDALKSIRNKMLQHANNPFALSEAQTISFRFDWRRDYISVQDGFSPNKHKSGMTPISMVGYPLVEILAAIGMTHARPCRTTKLVYRYGVLGQGEGLLPEPVFHRAALGAEASPVPGYPFRRFRMQLDWPGRKGDARCITQVTEEEMAQ